MHKTPAGDDLAYAGYVSSISDGLSLASYAEWQDRVALVLLLFELRQGIMLHQWRQQ